MKWSQIICPIVALAIAAVVFALIKGRQHSRYYLAGQARQIAEDLIATTNSARVIALGPRLREQLADYLSSPAAIQHVHFGDLPAPAGNGQAGVCVSITNATTRRLILRLASTSHPDKFDLLGFTFLVD